MYKRQGVRCLSLKGVLCLNPNPPPSPPPSSLLAAVELLNAEMNRRLNELLVVAKEEANLPPGVQFDMARGVWVLPLIYDAEEA